MTAAHVAGLIVGAYLGMWVPRLVVDWWWDRPRGGDSTPRIVAVGPEGRVAVTEDGETWTEGVDGKTWTERVP